MLRHRRGYGNRCVVNKKIAPPDLAKSTRPRCTLGTYPLLKNNLTSPPSPGKLSFDLSVGIHRDCHSCTANQCPCAKIFHGLCHSASLVEGRGEGWGVLLSSALWLRASGDPGSGRLKRAVESSEHAEMVDGREQEGDSPFRSGEDSCGMEALRKKSTGRPARREWGKKC